MVEVASDDPIRKKIDELTVRYVNGIDWLKAHDPTGSFYLWIKSGLTPMSPMPAQADDRRAEWLEYFRWYQRWKQLDEALLVLEAKVREQEAVTA